MSFNYRLNCGQYVLFKGDAPQTAPRDTVALLIDVEDGTLHKHGDPELVRKHHEQMAGKLRLAGCAEWANNLVVIEGRFELEDLNRCLDCSGFAGELYKRLQQGQLESQPFVS